MLFSSETIKAANKRKAEYSNKKPVIQESFTDKVYNKLLNESVEPFTAPAIEDFNYKDCLKSNILDTNNSIINIFTERIDQIHRKFHVCTNYWGDNSISIIKQTLSQIESINGDQLGIILCYIDHRYAPETYLVNIKRIIEDLNSYLKQVNLENIDILNIEDNLAPLDRASFLKEIESNEISSREILNDQMDFFNTPEYGRILSNNCSYVTDYLNKLATLILDLPDISFSENDSSLIKAKLMSVVSYKIKLIEKILEDFKYYTGCYAFSIVNIVKQNDDIFKYLYEYSENNRRDIIDASKVDPNYDIEESVLFHDLYSAYLEAYYNTEQLDMISESVGLIALTEAGNANIMKYINKVTTGISKAWNSFKEKMEDIRKKAVSKFTNKFKQKAEELPDDLQFEVQNMPELEDSKFNLLKVIPFNYEDMKEHLKSADTFVAKYYPGLNKNEGESLKDSMERYLTKGTTTVRITKDYILNSVIPILEKENSVVEQSVETDINVTNVSTKAISLISNKNNINKVSTTTTTTTTANNATNVNNIAPQNGSADVYAILGEADKEGVKIVDDENRTAAVDNGSILKDISIYLTVSSSVLSTKMKLIRQKELTAFRILVHAFTPPKKKKEEQPQK